MAGLWLSVGNLNNGVDNAGLSCVNANNGLSNGNWNILARISEIKMIIEPDGFARVAPCRLYYPALRRKLIK